MYFSLRARPSAPPFFLCVTEFIEIFIRLATHIGVFTSTVLSFDIMNQVAPTFPDVPAAGTEAFKLLAVKMDFHVVLDVHWI